MFYKFEVNTKMNISRNTVWDCLFYYDFNVQSNFKTTAKKATQSVPEAPPEFPVCSRGKIRSVAGTSGVFKIGMMLEGESIQQTCEK